MKPFLFPLLISIALFSGGCQKQAATTTTSGPPPAVPVAVATAEQRSVPFELRVVGNVEASSIVQVKSQVAGQLMKVNFTEGQNVAKGALLFEIDEQPYRDALRQAEAAVTRDRALIRQAEASLSRDQAQFKTADADAKRYGQLAQEGVIARNQSEQYRTNAEVYRESARATQASIESAKAAAEAGVAAVDRAKLDIAYCKIMAPLSGRAGNLLVHPGNLVKVNDVPLVVIHQLQPIFVNFSVPEQHLSAIRRLHAKRALLVRVFPKDDADRSGSGKLVVIDNTVDTATGTIKLKAELENRDSLLWPGQFVNVAMTLDTIQNAVVAPAEAVQPGQKGSFVYVVKADNTVESRPVTVGRAFERSLIIEKGVAAGEVLVTDGHLRLMPGALVKQVDAKVLENGKP